MAFQINFTVVFLNKLTANNLICHQFTISKRMPLKHLMLKAAEHWGLDPKFWSLMTIEGMRLRPYDTAHLLNLKGHQVLCITRKTISRHSGCKLRYNYSTKKMCRKNSK
ncbi:uncharacterized protein LOC108032148 [Drosophila biarmipes]|uniref:uncharacterized protein LOC108032148 n=1 Tax=Drosophila biarmipes TaxID=125945 RepID=UPI0007E7299D|nr:uncharacterized protein LOC108032148 [Drosophila biarmipes]